MARDTAHVRRTTTHHGASHTGSHALGRRDAGDSLLEYTDLSDTPNFRSLILVSEKTQPELPPT
eukprot:3010756-Rhodomonas_salina.1